MVERNSGNEKNVQLGPMTSSNALRDIPLNLINSTLNVNEDTLRYLSQYHVAGHILLLFFFCVCVFQLEWIYINNF